MATLQALAKYQFPLTEKPETPPSDKQTYADIFNIQNTLRMVLGVMTEDAPANGVEYSRKNNAWVPASGGGGGGGGIPEAPVDGKLYGRKDADWQEIPAPGDSSNIGANIVTTGYGGALATSWADYTVISKIASQVILNQAKKLSVSFLIGSSVAGSTVQISKVRILKTLPNSRNVVASASFKFGGNAGISAVASTANELIRLTTDDLIFNVTTGFDYWLVAYIPPTSASSTVIPRNVKDQGGLPDLIGYYWGGDQTEVSTIPAVPFTYSYGFTDVVVKG